MPYDGPFLPVGSIGTQQRIQHPSLTSFYALWANKLLINFNYQDFWVEIVSRRGVRVRVRLRWKGRRQNTSKKCEYLQVFYPTPALNECTGISNHCH